MGWGHCGTDDEGREIGYSIEALCDIKGCGKEIDRGLAYVCGTMHGGENGCGGYFCEWHRESHFCEERDNYLERMDKDGYEKKQSTRSLGSGEQGAKKGE